ncbi:acyl-CoA thioesterase [Candidatus Hydrogenedentota bacterium]
MARVKLDLPEDFPFSTEIPVRIGDVNYGGHMGHDAVLSLAHEARLRYFTQEGFTEFDVGGYGIIMTDAVVVYKAEAFHGNVLVIEIAAGDFSRSGCDFYFRITNRANGTEVARIKTGILIFDYEKKKVARMPENFRTAFHSA